MERYGAIWIWMGDPNKISNTSLPAFEYLSERDNEVSVGYLLTRANYQLSADNLLDLSHFQFLHPGTLGSAQMASGSTSTCKEAGDTVWCDRLYRGEFLREFVANAYGIPHGIAVDRRMVVRWDAPGLISIEITVTPSGAPLELGRTSLSGHFLTPESDTATHYFFAFGLPKTMGESAKTLVKYATEGLMTPFEKEDLPMLEAQQLALGNQDFWHAQPLMLPIDSAAIRARRIMARKLDAEARLAA
jgi:vanillate O-demethylase monooxygenase subunit